MVGGRQDVAVGHQHHQLRLDVDGLVVLLDRDIVARAHLALVEDAVLLERLDDVGLDRLGIGVDRRAVVQQPALGGFLLPLLRVAVAVEDDPLVLLHQLHEQRLTAAWSFLPSLSPFSSSVAQ